ncbi:MAG TPA: protein kinase [Gemmatimonadaceae bacterium]|nr:protein kinase [Gemmatimonadaceae bacterium]
MRRDRWDGIVTIFEQALECAPDTREQFLDTATRGDPELRERVAAMLRADSEPHSLLDAPDELPTVLRVSETDEHSGERVGPYTIVREIGRGGAATVYLASDEKHRRSVALKILHPDASAALGGDRFRREIEVVAQLQHPHILPLHDSGESNGLRYYVMPLVSGETLRDRIAREGALPLADIARIVDDVASALDYAHRRGVVHRDIKPGNILIDDVHASIADFGIAHLAAGDSAEPITATGVIIGTPTYMSPEQATGARDLDARSDIYAFGCVVFEMLTGVPPFRGGSFPVIVTQHLTAETPSARALRPELPAAVDDVLRRAMAKDPASRYPTMRELATALAASLTATALGPTAVVAPSQPAPAQPVTSKRRRTVAIVAAAVVLAIAALGVTMMTRRTESPSIAVLPFANMSDDRANEYFSDGVTEELTGALAQVGRLRVTPRTTAFAYKGKAGDITRIGRELGVDRILEGSVRRQNDRVRIVATMYDVSSGERLWSETYERAFGAVLPLQTEIAATIAERLQRRLLPGERARLTERHSVDPAAYDSYLKGRYFFDQRTAASLEQAVEHFRRALEIDSTYARAYAGLADTYSMLAWTGFAPSSELFPLAETAARRALSLDSALAEAHMSLGIIHEFHDWDWAGADRETGLAVQLDSTLAQGWYFRTWHLIATARDDDAMAALQHARRLDPLSLITNARIGTLLIWAHRYREADSVLRKTLEIDPSYPVARVQLARALSAEGKHAEAIAALPPDSVRLGSFESGIPGYVYARAGQRDRALAAARALEARPSVPAEGVAAVYAGLGDRATALTWLERATDARGIGLIFLAAEPMYDDLRSEPRYQRVVQRIGLTSRPSTR